MPGMTGLSTRQQADRLLGQAIKHSARCRGADAVYAHESVVSTLDRGQVPDVFEQLMAALTVPPESSEFRRYCEQARDKLEAGQ